MTWKTAGQKQPVQSPLCATANFSFHSFFFQKPQFQKM